MNVDPNGYLRDDKGRLIHRNVAYNEIYLPNRVAFPKPFREYVVHHIDYNKQNNHVSNLEILEQEEHQQKHDDEDSPYYDEWDGHRECEECDRPSGHYRFCFRCAKELGYK